MGDMMLAAILTSILIVGSCEVKSQREQDLENKLRHCMERPDPGGMP